LQEGVIEKGFCLVAFKRKYKASLEEELEDSRKER